jgi:hypothetical protein
MSKKNFFIFFLIFIVLSSCSKKKEEAGEEKEYSTSSGMEGQVYRANINYDSLLTVVDQATEMVAAYSSDINLRQKLVAISYDTSNGIIFASGRGRPQVNARTPSIAMNFAERAAQIEALKWAAYIERWKLDPTTPDLGKISAAMPPGRVVSKKVLPDSTVQVLVEVKAENM